MTDRRQDSRQNSQQEGPDSRRKRVLISAYSCAPGGGSEDGVGWAWARAAAVDHDVWVITRENNAPAIEDALGVEDRDHFHPIYLDLPRWARFWKRGLRGHRVYYVLWQLLVRRRSPCVIETNHIDITHHLTFASDSLPAGVVGAGGVPSVWGPVGGSQTLPPGFQRWVGRQGAMVERFRTIWLGVLRRLFGDRAARRATLTVALNRDVAERFAGTARQLVQRPNVAIHPCEVFGHEVVGRDGRRSDLARSDLARSDLARSDLSRSDLSRSGLSRSEVSGRSMCRDAGNPPVAVFAGRLIPWKGLRIAVASLAESPASDWRLEVYGEGPEEGPARRLAEELGVADRVSFHGRVERSELLERVRSADALLHPAMHDSSPWSVGEALSLGTPVVCLDHGGPPDIIGDDGGVAVSLLEDPAKGFAAGLEAVRGRRVPIDGRWSTERLPEVLADWYGRCDEEGMT